ncbi:unnamed protein product [Protopolystoma xenopodis]|uniref:Uncharacterized protein n=1 Tax=Protopolystoma xenopodis TaxID=117903 RepID=A0A448X553_9PLAT|nr:unnamed protein product [Protopolystoma xenopodis]
MPIIPVFAYFQAWRYSSGQLWTYWQSECHRLLVRDIELSITHDSSDAGYLYLIGRVLSGDSDSDLWHRDTRIIESSGGPTAWYFRFVSRLFYTTLSSQSSVDVEHLSSALTQWRRDEERDSITLTEGQAIKYGEDFQEPQPIDEVIHF